MPGIPHTLYGVTDQPERPRPTPDGSAREEAPPHPVDLADPAQAAASVEPVPVRNVTPPPTRGPLTAIELQPSQMVAAAGTAIVSAARVGRLLSRSGWRIARQLPGAKTVEREGYVFTDLTIPNQSPDYQITR